MSEQITLRSSGKDYRCLCPFHDDHSPSMYVSPSKQIYKCFSCGAAGNVIGFVQRFHKLSFPEALERLAERAGVPLPKLDGGQRPRGPSPSTLAQVNQWAAEFYHRTLLSDPQAQEARDYLSRRRLNADTVARFGLGYSPPGWDTLVKLGQRDGVPEDLLLAVGLIKPRREGSGYIDAFRHRLMFPINDQTGRVIGFGGRTLGDDQPKYLNTAETPIFSKGRCLFGLDQARVALQTSDCVVVVEGYTDVCMAHQHGICHVVATLGTALTVDQVRLLRRFSERVVVVYDGDAAGIRAADRALDVATAVGGDVRVATLPDNLDPCDLLVERGPQPFVESLSEATDSLAYLWSKVTQSLQRDSGLAARDAAVRRFLRSVASAADHRLIDPVDRGFLLNHLYGITGLPVDEIARELHSAGQPRSGQGQRSGQVAAPTSRATANRSARRFADAREVAYLDMLACVLCEPQLAARVASSVSLDEVQDFRLYFFLRHLLDTQDLGLPFSMAAALDLAPHGPTQQWLIQLMDRLSTSDDVKARLQRALDALEGLRQEQALQDQTQALRAGLAGRPGQVTVPDGGVSDDQLRQIEAMARRPNVRRVGPPV